MTVKGHSPLLIAMSFLIMLMLASGPPTYCAGYRVVEASGPAFHPNTVFSEPEDLTSPRFAELLEQYDLRKVVAQAGDEFERILLLRHWLNKRLVIDRRRPAESSDVLRMLEEGPAGAAYSCGHFEAALNAVLNSMGYVARCLISGPDGSEPGLTGTHGSNEVWCNSLCKWVLVDAEHDSHFERDGVPLSALELREAYLDDGGRGVIRVRGPAREPQPPSEHDQWGYSPKAHAFVSWRKQVNRFSIWPDGGTGEEIVYDDSFFKHNIWYRSGRKHWAYDAGKFIRVGDRNRIYWTPNVLDLKVGIVGSAAQITIRSCTPNLKTYQMKRGEHDWRAVGISLSINLSRSREELLFRSVNLAGVSGPLYRLVIEPSSP